MLKTVCLIVALGLTAVGFAKADKLDDIINSGKLRCAVTFDFPPMGSRDADNNPIGFDVDTCNDLAKALGVKAEIVETPFPQRIPALLSGKADVGVASTSNTLERAKTIGFSNPYFVFTFKLVRLRRNGQIANIPGQPGELAASILANSAGSDLPRFITSTASSSERNSAPGKTVSVSSLRIASHLIFRFFAG